MNLSEFPVLMQAERVLITASECRLMFPSNQVALAEDEFHKLSFSKRPRLVISNFDILAAQVENLTLNCKDLRDTSSLSILILRNAMFTARNELSVNNRRTMCQPDGGKRHSR